MSRLKRSKGDLALYSKNLHRLQMSQLQNLHYQFVHFRFQAVVVLRWVLDSERHLEWYLKRYS